jgi:hypothetical protein
MSSGGDVGSCAKTGLVSGSSGVDVDGTDGTAGDTGASNTPSSIGSVATEVGS